MDARNKFANVLKRYPLTNAQIYSDKELGSGYHTSVFEVIYMGLKCAGKRIHDHILKAKEIDSSIVERFDEECRLLSQVRHPNIVQFLGVYSEQGMRAPILVMEFLPTNLTTCIEQYGILPKEISHSILYDVALGLCYLHSQLKMTHRNLCSNKILLTSNMRAKISDLGMAKMIKNVSRSWTKPRGDTSFMAPEINVSKPTYSACVDTFSYGIMMIHVLCGKVPETKCSPVEFKGDKIVPISEAKRREEYLEAIGDHPLMSLILRCIHNDTKERPEANKIVKEFERIVSIPRPSTFQEHLDLLKDVIDDMKLNCSSTPDEQQDEHQEPDCATEDPYPETGPQTTNSEENEAVSISGTGTSDDVQHSPKDQNADSSECAMTTNSKHSKYKDKVSLSDLMVLKYFDDGNEKKLRIIREASYNWKVIADLIYPNYERGRVNTLERQYSSEASTCLRETFREAFIDKKPRKYSQDWDGLIELLEDADLQALSEEVKHALTCPLSITE